MRWIPELLLLTWTAGTLDGLSYLSGHVFTANMTGNTVLLSLHVVQGQFGPFLHNLTSLAAFSAGCMVGAFIFNETTRLRTARNLVLSARIEFPMLLAFGVLWLANQRTHTLGYATIVIAALALGIQSVAVRRLKIHGVVTTFISGTVTEAATGAASALLARRKTGRWPGGGSKTAVCVAILCTYLAAAAVAGYLSLHQPGAAAFISLPALLPVMVRSAEPRP
jgi:uncharacterized membrane protein YoaK (UPF0700 family)